MKPIGLPASIAALLALTLASLSFSLSQDRGSDDPRQAGRGRYFQKKSYVQHPLPVFSESKSLLPSPVYDEDPLLIRLYWKAWELAFRNFHEPAAGSGFVSQFIDAAFNDNIFLWDTAFMTMFCNVASPLVPGIASLDNFYAKQHPTGEICREIQRTSGRDFAPWVNTESNPLFSRWGWNFPPARQGSVVYRGREIPSPNPRLTLDAMNHPILAWAELESYRITGDVARLKMVWEPLTRYYQACQVYLRQGNGLYVTDWASMDNSPRNAYLDQGGTGIDISAEMVLFARNLSEIAHLLGDEDEAGRYTMEAEELAFSINRQMWSPTRNFYFDVSLDGKQVPAKTVAAYWTLLARVASPAQAKYLAQELENKETFGRLNPVPTCAANEPGYVGIGGYWRGAVWAPTNTMVIRGLEAYGYGDLARNIALRHLRTVAQVFEKTGTIWENYAPDAIEPGRHVDSALVAKDFVGWSGIAPILYFLEYAVGLKPDASRNQLLWNLQSDQRVGCERYRFNGHCTTLVADAASSEGPRGITIRSDGAFTLNVSSRGKSWSFSIHSGDNRVELR